VNRWTAITSTNIYHIRRYKVFQDGHALYFLLEYVPGGELCSYMRRYKRFTLEASKIYAAQLVSILEYLHSRNIAHRDLNPENILLDSYGKLKLVDFGCANIIKSRRYFQEKNLFPAFLGIISAHFFSDRVS
jgi:serine/threonine protein kinase